MRSTRYPPLRLSWTVWGLGAAFYLIGFYQRVAPGVLTQELMTDFALSAAGLGNLSAFYFYSYVAMQVPTGLLADHWGPRRLLTMGAMVTGVGSLMFAFAPDVSWANFGRLMIGGSVAVAFVGMLKLAGHWLPLGPEKGLLLNSFFVVLLIGSLLAVLFLFQRGYPSMLRWCLEHKALFMAFPLVVVLLGGFIWLGFESFFGWLPQSFKQTRTVTYLVHKFPGLGKEFMPPLEEGSFLYMPTTMQHASIGEVQEVLSIQDRRISAILSR